MNAALAGRHCMHPSSQSRPPQDARDPDNPQLMIQVRRARLEHSCGRWLAGPACCGRLPFAAMQLPRGHWLRMPPRSCQPIPRLISQHILHGAYDLPPDVPLSAECRDLLARILVRDPARRITLAQVRGPESTCAEPPELGAGQGVGSV